MSDQERAVLVALAAAWNEFLTLPDLNSDDVTEFRHGLHRLQEKVMARAAKREEPGFFN